MHSFCSEDVVMLVQSHTMTLQPHRCNETFLSIPLHHHHHNQSHQGYIHLCFPWPVTQWKLLHKCWIWMEAPSRPASFSFVFSSSQQCCHCFFAGWGWTGLLYAFEGGGFKQYFETQLCHLFTWVFSFDFNLTSVLHSANVETIKYRQHAFQHKRVYWSWTHI